MQKPLSMWRLKAYHYMWARKWQDATQCKNFLAALAAADSVYRVYEGRGIQDPPKSNLSPMGRG